MERNKQRDGTDTRYINKEQELLKHGNPCPVPPLTFSSIYFHRTSENGRALGCSKFKHKKHSGIL